MLPALEAVLFGASYDPAALAIFNAFTVQPDPVRKALINSTVLALKAAGVWTLLDFLQVYAASDSQAALINWVNPGTFNGAVVNSPVFTADRDFTGNGSTSYVDSNFNPSTAGGKFIQNSAYYGIWVRSTGTQPASIAGFFNGTDGVLRQTRSPSSEISGRINQATATTSATGGTQTDASGLSGMARSASNVTRFAHNGVDVVTGAVASTALVNGTLRVGATGISFNTVPYAAQMAGQNLTQPQELALYNALQAYMTAVGA